MSSLALSVADELVSAGVGAAFGISGSSSSLALLARLEDRGLPVIRVGHEAAGAVMAGAFSKQSGSLGCAVSIKGPGLANLLPGLVCAHFEQWPLISISEAYDPAVPYRAHKWLDHKAAVAWCVKAYASLGDPKATIATLAASARQEIRGPAHLDLFAPAGKGQQESFGSLDRQASSAKGVEAVLQHVAAAQRPLVIVGGLACRREWGRRLQQLHVPVLSTVAAKGVLDETSPWAAGVFTGHGGPLAPEGALIRGSDLVVGLGLRNLEVLGVFPFETPLVSIDEVDASYVSGWTPVAVSSAPQPETASLVEEVLEAIGERSWGDALVAETVARVRGSLTAHEWLPGSLLTTLEKLAPPSAVLVVDTGSFAVVAEHFWRAREPRGFLGSANGRYMGTALPMALGAALADPSRPVVCLVGDGGLPPHVAELRLAVARKLRLLLVLLTDGRFGSVAAASPEGAHRSFISVSDPSWLRAIEGLGCPARRAENGDSFADHLTGWDPEQGPLFKALRGIEWAKTVA